MAQAYVNAGAPLSGMFRWHAGGFPDRSARRWSGQFDTLLAARSIEVSLTLIEEKR